LAADCGGGARGGGGPGRLGWGERVVRDERRGGFRGGGRIGLKLVWLIDIWDGTEEEGEEPGGFRRAGWVVEGEEAFLVGHDEGSTLGMSITLKLMEIKWRSGHEMRGDKAHNCGHRLLFTHEGMKVDDEDW
jgi:hypothetical protein